jgi:hypothetical protein
MKAFSRYWNPYPCNCRIYMFPRYLYLRIVAFQKNAVINSLKKYTLEYVEQTLLWFRWLCPCKAAVVRQKVGSAETSQSEFGSLVCTGRTDDVLFFVSLLHSIQH